MKGEREEESIPGRGLTRVKTQRREGRRDTVALQKLKHGVGENPEVPKVSWLCQRASVLFSPLVLSNSATPWTVALQASLPFTTS